MSIRLRSSLAVCTGLLVAGVARGAPPPATPSAQDEPLDKYRERFKAGMDRYKAGDLTGAIAAWEPLLRELGEQKGYRLAYDLGVAYAELGDGPRAVDRLQEFLAEIEVRQSRGESLAAIVHKEEADARARLERLVPQTAHPRVEAPPPPLVVAPPSPSPSPPPPAPPPARAETPPLERRIAAPLVVQRETEHPFSPAFFVVGGGLALAAGLVAVPLENHAWDLHARYVAEQEQSGLVPAGDRQAFSDARTWAYTAVGAAIGLGVVTASLAAWYFLGTSRREVVVTPAGVRF
jgi:hypothetical protein